MLFVTSRERTIQTPCSHEPATPGRSTGTEAAAGCAGWPVAAARHRVRMLGKRQQKAAVLMPATAAPSNTPRMPRVSIQRPLGRLRAQASCIIPRSSPLFSQIASRWFDILPWQPEEANLDLARAIPPPPRARHCTCPPARPSAILEEPPGFRRQDLRRDASEQPRWLISDASEHPRAEPTRLRDFV